MQTSILRTGGGVRPINNGTPIALLMAGGKGQRVTWVEKFDSTLALKFGTVEGMSPDLRTVRVRDPQHADRTVYIPLALIGGGFVIDR